jgi:hypothetical protein
MEYSVDKWVKNIENWNAFTLKNEQYKPATNYILIPIGNTIDKTIETLFPGEYFFKLSTRSPKDVLENKIKIKSKDHRTVKLEKKKKQLDILKVSSVEDVKYLLRKSKRIKEDIKIFQKIDKLYLVFQPWRPSLGISTEYRCFINFRKLVGVCLYKPEYYSSLSSIPIEMISHFISQLLNVIKYVKFVVDIFIKKDDDKVYFIEINPFDEATDTFSFDEYEINNTSQLLVTL